MTITEQRERQLRLNEDQLNETKRANRAQEKQARRSMVVNAITSGLSNVASSVLRGPVAAATKLLVGNRDARNSRYRPNSNQSYESTLIGKPDHAYDGSLWN